MAEAETSFQVSDPAVDVLVVDDSPDTCRAIKRLLRTAGHTADCLPDGHAALEYLADRLADDLPFPAHRLRIDRCAWRGVVQRHSRGSGAAASRR